MLDEVVKLMEGGSSAFGVAGAQVIAEARLESLQTLLAAIAGTSDDRNVTLSLDQQVAVAIVRDLPGLADDADKLLAHARKPRVAPLIAAVDQQVLITQSYEAVQATNGKRANAARQQLEAALDESLALARVLYALSENRSWGERSISKLDASLPAAAKIAFYRAQATYAAEVQQFRVETEVWVARERAAQYEKELVLSKFAAARWDGLIETLTTMATEYHAHGTNDTNLGKFFKELRLTVELAHTSLREHVALNHAMLAARMDEIRDEAQLAARARARREFENFIDRKAALPARDDPASLMRSFGDEGRKIRERETLALGKIAESSNSDAAILAELPTTKVAAAQNRFGILMQELSPKEWLALAVGYATKIRADVGNLPSQSKHGVWIRRQDSAR